MTILAKTRSKPEPPHLRLVGGGMKRRRLVVLGNGMVSAYLCRRMKERGLLALFEVSVIGDEPCPAYDRVHLGRCLEGHAATELELASAAWYQEQNITLALDDAAIELDAKQRVVTTKSGATFAYDELVFATGSRPRRPPFDGNEHESVTTYRDVRDAEKINALAERALQAHRPLVILGGGLLGLEAAEALRKRGVDVVIVESSAYLMPRQLTRDASRNVAARLRAADYRLELNTRIKSVAPRQEGTATLLRVELDNDKALVAAGVVISAGVRPQDELAKRSGIKCDTYGGIEVDDAMHTSDSQVWAVGECARHANTCYGLVAPGYQMAEVLLDRLQGKNTRFKSVRTSTRLKVESIELSVVGESYLEGADVRNLTLVSGGSYRALVIRNSRLIGATAVGPWDSFPSVQAAVGRQERFGSKRASKFLRGRELWPNEVVDVSRWADDAIVCSCTGVNCGSLRAAKADGCNDLISLKARTSAGTGCGTCEPLLQSLVSGQGSSRTGPGRWPLPLGVTSALLALLIVLAPPIALVDSAIASVQYDALWRNTTLRQVTGFSALAMMAVAALLAVRKRFTWANFGSFDGWRKVHLLVGNLALVALVAHTGFRLGIGIDRVLMLTFLAAAALGSIASGVLALEQRLGSLRGARLRRTYNAVHFWLTWPLPILVAVHVFKVYFF